MSWSSPNLARKLKLVPAPESGVAATKPAPTLDDTELLKALKSGDVGAATALHDRVRPQVDRTIRRLLGRDVDHDDLAQLAMIQLAESMHNYRGECSLVTWISRVTAYTVMKELPKRRTRRAVFSDVEGVADLAESSVDLERQTVSRDALRRVRIHIDAMEPTKAWAVVLHDVCGHDLEEIAALTGVSTSAAQTRLSRGRRDLHRRIAEDPMLAELLRERARPR